ncbi:DnaJ-domain-containing protein [Gigaspora margarita]|uniref:DnaJ-domain-containing protein n=1 Tax=Gigaspora margarita TaxID=4874 RepID=A0A8H4AHM6_GIGMA|nr:DnaJ-domain-containing protein [Gigaspora margarita]
MGTHVIISRKPEFFHRQCNHCSSQLEFQIPSTLTPPSQLSVKCYSCQNINSYEIDQEATTILNGTNSNKTGGSKKNSRRQFGTAQEPLETELYEILGVSPTASSSEIKKQYHKLALQFHPDKNKSADAEQQFKKISDAYQILSNPDLRQRYNEFGGKNNVEPEGGFVNPEDFFRQQFGGERFVDIIGEISIGRDMKEVLQKADEMNEEGLTEEEKIRRETTSKTAHDEERDRIRQQRIDKLVYNLVHKLSMYVEGIDHNSSAASDFKSIIEYEADELKAESYGVELLHAIGFTYSLKAKQYLGSEQFFGVPRFGHILREKGHVFSETISTLRSAIDLQQSFKELQKAEQDGVNAQEKSKLEEATASKGLTALWKGSKLEVEGVLREVCDRVLSDPNVPKSVLKKRAEGLKIIGSVYENAKGDIQ